MMDEAIQDLKEMINPEKAAFFPRFFRTGPGEYGEGDMFLGVTVPELRKIAKKHAGRLSLEDLEGMLLNPYHEIRLMALIVMTFQYEKGEEKVKEQLVELYLRNLHRINNWDLVDTSAHKIIGAHLYKRDRELLYDLALRDHLWSQRVSIIATLYFIQKNEFEDTLKLAKILKNHPHDLIHKAVGWMLREVGKRDEQIEIDFLDVHYRTMPRTMLRYAIEKFEEPLRQAYLKGTRTTAERREHKDSIRKDGAL